MFAFDCELLNELLRDRNNAAAIAVFCRWMKVAADSEERLGSGVTGRLGSGFMTCSPPPGPMDSRKLSPCANGRGQLSRLTLIGPPSKSGVLLRVVVTAGASGREVSWVHFRARTGRMPFSLMESVGSRAGFRRRRRRRRKHITTPMSTRPAMAPERPPMTACRYGSREDEAYGVCAMKDVVLSAFGEVVDVGLPDVGRRVTVGDNVVCRALTAFAGDDVLRSDRASVGSGRIMSVVTVVREVRTTVVYTVPASVIVVIPRGSDVGVADPVKITPTSEVKIETNSPSGMERRCRISSSDAAPSRCIALIVARDTARQPCAS